MRREAAIVPFFFLAAVFCATFEKVQWNVAGSVFLADVTALGFLVAFALDRLGRGSGRVPRTAAVLIAFLSAFLLVYLIGFFNLETTQALDQFGKGLAKWLIHFAFLIVGVVYLTGRSVRFYWRTLGWFLGGIAFNAAYGIVQLLAAQSGRNLDSLVLEPLTRGASQINVYGAVNGASVYRPNALTGDPNHLGIMLLMPLLILSPIYLRLERGHRLRLWLAALIAFLLVVELATLSRSGALGLVVGAIVLLYPYRHLLFSRLILFPLALVVLPVAYEVYRRRHFFDVVIRSRLSHGTGATTHLDVYSFIPKILHVHPFFGLGFNNFSVYYEFVTGKTNWGPHSYYVALIVEGGLVGTALFAVFLWYLFVRLGAARRLGRALAAARNPVAARLRPLAWGMTAALLGTMAANVFYLTMSFLYFYVFAMLVLVTPAVFSRPLRSRSASDPRLDRSFPTDARTKSVRPEAGTASGAS
jgi:O-antigen ligase/polysaccharide polymerase Wzy-like membrane protein